MFTLLFKAKRPVHIRSSVRTTKTGKVVPVKPYVEQRTTMSSAMMRARAHMLRVKADALEAQIEQKLHPAISEQNQTARRARIASGMYDDGMRLQEIQRLLRQLADGFDQGTLPPILQGLSQTSQIQQLRSAIKWKSEYPVTPPDSVNDWLKENREKERAALARAGILNATQYEAAKTALAAFLTQVPLETSTEKRLRDLNTHLIQNSIPDFFETPEPLADRLASLGDIQPGMTVLTPDSGRGRITEAVKRLVPEVDPKVIEINSTLREVLTLKGFDLVGDDFLKHKEHYDRILMNPPFSNGQDIIHVMHAYSLLNPGGRLVAIMSESPFFRDTKLATSFMEFLAFHGTSEQLPANTFSGHKELRQTGVSTRLVVITKPRDDLAKARVRQHTRTEPSGKVSVVHEYDRKDRSAAFRSWFKDSKVVDADGNPLVVYHGTDQVFESFSRKKLGFNTDAKSAKKGFFFTDNARAAARYPVYDQDLLLDYGGMSVKRPPAYYKDTAAFRNMKPGQDVLSKEVLETDEYKRYKKELDEARRVAEEENILATGLAASMALKDIERKGWSLRRSNRITATNDEWVAFDNAIHGKPVTGKLSNPEYQALYEEAIPHLEALRESNDFSYIYQFSKQAWEGGDQEGEAWEAKKDTLAPNIMPVYLSIQNPLVHEQETAYRDISYAQLLDEAKAGGHDGLIIRNTKDPLYMNVYVAMDETQIKSATGNIGTYDLNNADITKAHIKTYTRTDDSGKLVTVTEHEDKRTPAQPYMAHPRHKKPQDTAASPRQGTLPDSATREQVRAKLEQEKEAEDSERQSARATPEYLTTRDVVTGWSAEPGGYSEGTTGYSNHEFKDVPESTGIVISLSDKDLIEAFRTKTIKQKNTSYRRRANEPHNFVHLTVKKTDIDSDRAIALTDVPWSQVMTIRMPSSETTAREEEPLNINQDLAKEFQLTAEEQKMFSVWFSGEDDTKAYNKLRKSPAMKEAVRKAPVYRGVVYRGMILPTKDLKEIQSKKTFSITKLSSGTTEQSTAEDFMMRMAEDGHRGQAVVFHIETKSGRDVADLAGDLGSGYGNEGEVILGAEDKIYRVTKIVEGTLQFDGSAMLVIHAKEQ